MAESNYLCETAKCHNPATAFGLKGTLKLRSCNKHIPSLLSKQMTVHGMERYDVISDEQDAAEFEEKKAAVAKGLGNLAVLGTGVDAECAAALQLLGSEKEQVLKLIEAVFSDIREAVTKRCSDVKQQLASLEANFSQYLQHPENALSPGSELLCSEVLSTPPFIQLVIEGISNPVARTISKYWSVSGTNVESILMAAEFADSSTAHSYCTKGSQFKAARQWTKAEECYLKAKEIYNIIDPRSISAASNLSCIGEVYTNMERWEEAETYFKKAMDFFEGEETTTIYAANCFTSYGYFCYKTERLDEATKYYNTVKQFYERVELKNMDTANNLTKLGLVLQQQENECHAITVYSQAQQILDKIAPNSIEAGENLYHLGRACYDAYSWKKSVKSYLKAQSIFRMRNSEPLLLANCTLLLGLAYEAQRKISDSIGSYLYAARMFRDLGDEERSVKAENLALRAEKQAKSSEKR